MTLPRSFVRPLVRPLVRSGAVGPYGGATYQDGIHLNFASGNTTSGYYVKAVGAAPTVSALTSLFTFTGGNQSMYMGPGGLLVASATNTPRIEYDANGNCLGLLMEAARTNLAIQSADLTGYSLTNVTVGGNAIAAPDGTTTADSITETVTSGVHRAGGTNIGVANAVNTFSCFVKAGLRTVGRLRLGGASGSTLAVFNLSTVTITPSTPSGNGTCTAATITALPNGWFRITATGVPDSTSGLTFQPSIDLDDGSLTFSYAGNSGSVAMYAWGLQVEQASFASSYIPTTTVSVARTADSCIRTLGSEFSATAGTVVVNVADFISADVAANNCIASLDDATANERLTLQRTNTAGAMRLNVFDGGANQAAVDGLSAISTAGVRLAYAFAANDFAISGNGGAVVTDGAGTLPTVTRLDLGSRLTGEHLFGHILRFDYWPERKANAFLVSAST